MLSSRLWILGLFLFCAVQLAQAEETEAPVEDKGTIGIACMDSEGKIYSPDRDPEAYEACLKQREQQAPSNSN